MIEFTFLLNICKEYVLNSNKANQLNIDLPNNINWDKIAQLAAYHRIRPLLYEALQKSSIKHQIPVLFLEKLKQQRLKFLFQNLSNAKELARLLKLFKTHGIDVIPYKGILLGQEAYQNISIRESSDIDILIQQKDFDKISNLLIAENYQYEKKTSSLSKKLNFKFYCELNFDFYEGGIRRYHVEPHWTLGGKMYQTYIDYNTTQAFTKKELFLEHEINKLTPEGLLITTIVHHGGTDRWLYLKHIIDLALIVERFGGILDWELVIKKCQQLKIINILLLGLSLVQDFFGISLPIIITKKIEQNGLKKLIKYQKIKIKSKTKKSKPLGNLLGRVYYFLLLRKSWITKVKIIYYNFLHFFLKPFTGKYLHS